MYYLAFTPQATTTAAYQTLIKDCDLLPMNLRPDLALLMIGAGIGLGTAVIGAFSDYWLSFRSGAADRQYQLPGCLLYAVGGLALAGIVSLVASFLLNGSIRPALILGAGVLGGFYVGFILLFILWFFINR